MCQLHMTHKRWGAVDEFSSYFEPRTRAFYRIFMNLFRTLCIGCYESLVISAIPELIWQVVKWKKIYNKITTHSTFVLPVNFPSMQLQLIFRCMEGTKVRRYNWHSAGSLGWLFPKLKYTVSQKTRHLTLAHNFTNYWPIFKIISLLHSAGNL